MTESHKHISRREMLAGAVGGALGAVASRVGVAQGAENDLNDVRAQAQVAYRQGVDAERLATIIFMAVTQQEGQPQNLEYYREVFNDAVDRAGRGEDPLSTGFWKNGQEEILNGKR